MGNHTRVRESSNMPRGSSTVISKLEGGMQIGGDWIRSSVMLHRRKFQFAKVLAVLLVGAMLNVSCGVEPSLRLLRHVPHRRPPFCAQ